MSSQLDRIKRADDLLSTVYEEMLNGDIEDDCFERTPIEQQRVCCNCRNRRTSETVSKCMIDGHYIGYVQCFTNWCRHWATDELKWIGGDSE